MKLRVGWRPSEALNSLFLADKRSETTRKLLFSQTVALPAPGISTGGFLLYTAYMQRAIAGYNRQTAVGYHRSVGVSALATGVFVGRPTLKYAAI